MTRYVVEIKETRVHKCVVDASSQEEAEELVMEDYILYSVDDQFDEVVLMGSDQYD